jgi:hypothetical protein
MPAHWREETDEVGFVSCANTVNLARRSRWIVDNSSMNDWIVLVTHHAKSRVGLSTGGAST